MLMMHRGPPLLCPLKSGLYLKKYVGNKRFLLKMHFPNGRPPCFSMSNIAKACRLQQPQQNGSVPLDHKEQRKMQHKREWKKARSCLIAGEVGTSEWVCLSGENPFWKLKSLPFNPSLFHSLLWFSTQTHLEVLKCNRDEILAMLLLYSISTVLI